MTEHIGVRLRAYRGQLRMTQQEVADELAALGYEYSRSAVAHWELGLSACNNRGVVAALAKILCVDVQNLIDSPSHRPTSAERDLRASVPSIRAALEQALELPEPISNDQFRQDVSSVLAARMTCDYTHLGKMLPTTLARAMAANDARALSHLATCASLALRPIGYVDLAVNLANVASANATDATSAGMADYALAQCHLSGGTEGLRSRSYAVAAGAADLMGEQRRADLPRPVAEEMFGVEAMLRLHAALAAASVGNADNSASQLAEATALTQRANGRPSTMEPTAANAGVWAVAIQLELGRPGMALEAYRGVAASQLKTTQRKAHLLTHGSRASYEVGDTEQAAVMVLSAYKIAESEVAWRSSVRDTIGAIMRDPTRTGACVPLHELAVKMGIDPLSVG